MSGEKKRYRYGPGAPCVDELERDQQEKKVVVVIDAEPSWESLLSLLVDQAVAGDSLGRRLEAKKELLEMARAADAYRQLQKSGKLPK